MIRWIPPVLLVLLGVLVFRRLAMYSASRGWIYYGNGPKRGNTVGSLGFEQVFQPSIEHVIEEQQRLQIEAKHEESSDDQGTGYGVQGTPSDSEEDS